MNTTTKTAIALSPEVLNSHLFRNKETDVINQHLKSVAAFEYITAPNNIATRLGLLRHRAEELQADRLDAIETRNASAYGSRAYDKAEAAEEDLTEQIRLLVVAGHLIKTCGTELVGIKDFFSSSSAVAELIDDMEGWESMIEATLIA